MSATPQNAQAQRKSVETDYVYEKKRLQRKRDWWLAYSRRKRGYPIIGLGVGLYGLLAIELYALSSLFIFGVFGIVLEVIAAVLVLQRFFTKVDKPERPTTEERGFIILSDALAHFQDYFRSKEGDRDLLAKEKAAGILKRYASFLSNRNWTTGYFRILRDSAGLRLSTFIKLTKQSLVPLARSTDDKEIQAAYDLTREICDYLLEPSLKEIDIINSKLAGLYSEKPRWYQALPAVTIPIILVGLTGFGCFAFGEAAAIYGIPAGNAFAGAITLFAALVGFEIFLMRKRSGAGLQNSED